MTELTAEEVIGLLKLEPHPEGGYFRETYRDHNSDGSRASSTAIYFLLAAGEISRWHRIDAAEVWHWHAGAPLELTVAPPDGTTSYVLTKLGADLRAEQLPQAVVPANHWQQARSLGDWTLVGVTVAPGFTFDALEFAEEGFAPPRTMQRAD